MRGGRAAREKGNRAQARYVEHCKDHGVWAIDTHEGRSGPVDVVELPRWGRPRLVQVKAVRDRHAGKTLYPKAVRAMKDALRDECEAAGALPKVVWARDDGGFELL